MKLTAIRLVLAIILAGCVPELRVYGPNAEEITDGGVSEGGDCSMTDSCGEDAGCDGDDCSASSCDDGAKNGDETDVDCGGTNCARCSVGQTCLTNEDCANGNCSTAIGKCQ